MAKKQKKQARPPRPAHRDELAALNDELRAKLADFQAAKNDLELLQKQLVQRTTDLAASNQKLQAIVDTAVDAIITIDDQGTILAANPATQRMFAYTAAEMIGRNVKVLMPSPYQEQHASFVENYLRTGEKKIIGIGREVLGRRKDGTTFPIDLGISEIPELRLFTGILHDLTRRKQLEREVVEIASLQQRRIGQDLHDELGQELIALSIVADELFESLERESSRHAELASRIAEGLKRAVASVRAVSRGLLPVEVDSGGLMAALADLAARAAKEGQVSCVFRCPEPVLVEDNITATHLYYIAQEAVNNALKHAHPRVLGIELETAGRMIVLRVRDDGRGVPDPLPEHEGLGLRIMRNRAGLIGAALAIKPATPKGTLVTCTLVGKEP